MGIRDLAQVLGRSYSNSVFSLSQRDLNSVMNYFSSDSTAERKPASPPHILSRYLRRSSDDRARAA